MFVNLFLKWLTPGPRNNIFSCCIRHVVLGKSRARVSVWYCKNIVLILSTNWPIGSIKRVLSASISYLLAKNINTGTKITDLGLQPSLNLITSSVIATVNRINVILWLWLKELPSSLLHHFKMHYMYIN